MVQVAARAIVVADFRSSELKNFYRHTITIVQKSWRWLRRTLGRFPTLSSLKARTDVAAGLLPVGHIRRVSSPGIHERNSAEHYAFACWRSALWLT